jgi:SNF family Na+-dependent transporter
MIPSLAITVLLLPPGPGGATPWQGLEFIYRPDLSRLDEPSVWLAAAGQIFFTLSVGMGTLQTYASYLSKRDDIALSGVATAATNETAEVVLGGTIAIPAAVTFFGVAGATAIAQSGAFNLGFATMPVVFQQIDRMVPVGNLLGFAWFGLLFFAGITSSVAMATPVVAFFREEFGFRREPVAWSIGALALLFGLWHILWFEHGMLDEWDYWAGTFGLVLFAVIETILFVWVFRPDNAWRSIHEGADIRIVPLYKVIMTYVTPVYLVVLLAWWGVRDALPLLLLENVPPERVPYVIVSRGVLVAFAVAALVLVRLAWRRNGYDDRIGFPLVGWRESALPPESVAKAVV